ncbi:MAG: bifunctional folylpolyglutamate synthase/dihydrofolate synthase [Bradyrhizobium sp.]|nr:bifunctional folylpolyglutamate synthase/dihydrofolate synthase [Pseudomonadota bacterium]MDE2243899.1 bifunctional folylpolyglutamate synthase/dihydrofolate synthase [Bradyrhizobium sp.]
MFELPKYGEGICLARLAALLESLAVNREWLERRSVVVTGSNGKGSTAAFCASIGNAHGLRTGLFTSPHLYRINERFQIDGSPIGDGELANLAARVSAGIARVSARLSQRFGAFEAMFALACLYFQESRCDFAVFEAGIGGRYDPVRLVETRVTCVTSVDYEHVELLGNSLELIASDKSDACASGGTVVYGENCLNLKPHLLEYNRHREVASLFVREQIVIDGEVASASGQRFGYRFEGQDFPALEIGVLGGFQFNNAAIAVTLFLLWLRESRPQTIPAAIESTIRSGLRETRWPGRLEVIEKNPLTVIDVGHTPDGIKQSLTSLRSIHGTDGWILVTGASADKKADEIVRALAPAFRIIICTKAYHKGTDAQTIAASVRAANPNARVDVTATIEDSVELSRSLAKSRNRKIYVPGGLFLAIEFATVARGGNARDLTFF